MAMRRFKLLRRMQQRRERDAYAPSGCIGFGTRWVRTGGYLKFQQLWYQDNALLAWVGKQVHVDSSDAFFSETVSVTDTNSWTRLICYAKVDYHRSGMLTPEERAKRDHDATEKQAQP